MSIMTVSAPWQNSISEPAVSAVMPPSDRVKFVGDRGAYWRLMICGGTLQAITLGIYRFWQFTDMRRFLWANTEVDGESLEYTGTPVELLLGFLVAIGILIPIYGLLFVGSLEMGALSSFSSIVGFAVLACFGQYAAYRARRYRLTRTVLRGVRFHQTGSAFGYALRSVLWWIAIVCTIGLALPAAQASLERYKMRHTFYGDLAGSFAGKASQLFWRGILIWIVIVSPTMTGIVGAIGLSARSATAAGVVNPATVSAAKALGTFSPVAALIFAGIFVSLLLWAVLYPAYQAIALRWWLSGLRFGGAAAASDLKIRRVYGAYLRFFLYVLLFSVAFGVVAYMVGKLGHGALSSMTDLKTSSPLRDGAATAAAALGYIAFMLVASTIFQVVVKFRLWQVAAELIEITGLSTLANVRASEASSSAVGEGLADALGSGGF